VDALRDLDDALTLVHLFAHLPASAAHHIPGPALTRCKRLVLEWQAYCARTSGLRRVFISVKGWYYQAEVAGQAVTWLVPHAVSQVGSGGRGAQGCGGREADRPPADV
jgi:pescadillo protein